MTRFIIAAVLLFIASSAHAFNFSKFSSCSVDGQEIRTTLGSEPQSAIAWLDEKTNKLLITIDWRIAQTFSEDALMFIYLHECAHHKLGHTTKEAIQTRRTRRGFNPTMSSEEVDADCLAKRDYVDKYGEKKFNNAIKELEILNGPWRTSRIQQCQ